MSQNSNITYHNLKKVTAELGVDQHLRPLSSDSATLTLPLTCVPQIFYRKENDTLLVSADVRRLVRADDQIDPCGLYSLLQFGAAAPPFTPWKEIRRFTPGAKSIIRSSDISIQEMDINWEHRSPDAAPTIEEQSRLINSTLDEVLKSICHDRKTTILFSGGTDSGLLAARCAALGWEGTTLVNYGFGPDDPEATLAESMAAHLALEFVRVDHSEFDALSVLRDAGSLFPIPFCDHSSVPTFGLVQGVKTRLDDPGLILDGTGADGAFGLFGKVPAWRRLYNLPYLARSVASKFYGELNLWRHDSRTERLLRILRRSTQHSTFFLAAVAQNPLLGVFYSFPSEVIEQVSEQISEWMSCTLPSEDPRVLFGGIDLALVCAGIFAQKDFWPLKAEGYRIEYPFLHRRMVSLALEYGYQWPLGREAKQAIKHALSASVPRHMVYRPKSGFIAPMEKYFCTSEFLTYYDRLLDRDAILADFLHRKPLSRLRECLLEGSKLPTQTLNFVWAATFINRWLEQVMATARTRTHSVQANSGQGKFGIASKDS